MHNDSRIVVPAPKRVLTFQNGDVDQLRNKRAMQIWEAQKSLDLLFSSLGGGEMARKLFIKH